MTESEPKALLYKVIKGDDKDIEQKLNDLSEKYNISVLTSVKAHNSGIMLILELNRKNL